MKVALCLFGLVGGSSGKNGEGTEIDPKIAHESVKEHILDRNDVDVFIHSWSVDKKDELLSLYDPVRHVIEKQVIFDAIVDVQRARSRWYSTRACIDLVGDGYDMIMLSRIDLMYYIDINFSDYSPAYFYASHWNDVGNRVNHTSGFMDMWFFGGAEIMRKFGQLSLYIDNYSVSQHKASQQHARFIGANVKHVMYRGYDFEMVRRAILKCKK